jgi:DNA-binding transcriptional regulator YhcF (GntR family)
MGGREQKRRREAELRRIIRERVVNGIHTGRLNAADRLPTYREVARETGADLRAVAHAYAALEKEGLVEIRGRSGVFVAPQDRLGEGILTETSRWMISVLSGARTRDIPLPEFPAFVQRCIRTAEVRCACVEETDDELSAICEELRAAFGLRPLPVAAERLREGPRDGVPTDLPAEILKADFLTSTVYHAAGLRRIAEALGKPLVIIRLNPEIVKQLRQLAADGPLTLIHVDSRFAQRVRQTVEPYGDHVRGVLATDDGAVRRIDRSRPVLVSPAARRRLRERDLAPPLLTGALISKEATEEIIELLLRFNLDAMQDGS